MAVRITREGFNTILSHALTGHDEKVQGMKEKSCVRLQWDPDHDPSGTPQKRKAIQLGLRNEVYHINTVMTSYNHALYITVLVLLDSATLWRRVDCRD